MAGSSDLVNNAIFLTITGRAAGKEIHMPYTEKKIIIGDIMEVMRYHSTKGGSVQRGKKEKASTPAQKKANEIRTGNELWRVIYINFDGQQGDQFNTFTFAEDIGEEDARKEWRNFTRRVRRYLKKNGLPDLKYVYTLEKQGRWHIHAVMNGIPLKDLTKLWGRGRVSSSILDKTNDYRDLAAYITKNIEPEGETAAGEPEGKKKNKRSWSGSLNLERPVVIVREIKRESIMRKVPTAPKGYILLPDWEIGCDSWGNLYQRYKCRKIAAPGRKKRQERKAKKTTANKRR